MAILNCAVYCTAALLNGLSGVFPNLYELPPSRSERTTLSNAGNTSAVPLVFQMSMGSLTSVFLLLVCLPIKNQNIVDNTFEVLFPFSAEY